MHVVFQMDASLISTKSFFQEFSGRFYLSVCCSSVIVCKKEMIKLKTLALGGM